MSQLIRSETININELISKDIYINGTLKTKMIDILKEELTEEEIRWYITNLYIYLNYNQTTDYPINIDTVAKLLGFANKANAKRTLVNNFTVNEDYKSTIIPRADGKFTEEIIMLNIDTFKNLCLLVKSEKGKKIRRYYVKLENIYNKINKMEMENKDKLLQLKDSELITQKQITINTLKNTLLDSYDNKCVVYLIKIKDTLYKYGYSDDIQNRFKSHIREINKDIELVYCIESKNNVLLEKKIKKYLEESNIKINKVINEKNQTELFQINNVQIIINQLESYNKNIYEDKEKIKNDGLQIEVRKLELENENLKLKYQSEKISLELNNSNIELLKLQNTITPIKNTIIIAPIENIITIAEPIQESIQTAIIKPKKVAMTSKERDYKYRHSENYKLKTQTVEFKEREKLRYQKRSSTESHKHTRRQHYQENKVLIDAKKLETKRLNSKTTLTNSPEEKSKFFNWLSLNIKECQDNNLIWNILITEYLGYKTSALISSKYRIYFEEYTKVNFNIILKYKRVFYGYKNFGLI